MNLQQRKELVDYYKEWTPRSDPYKYFDWENHFSPIESLVWGDIRFLGLPFYPEFPVDKYFIDFADPIEKIGIEVDGKEFHQDYEKDLIRQKYLESLGWKIFRIEGKKCFRQITEYVTDKDREFLTDEELKPLLTNYFKESSEGILLKIKNEYYK